MTRWIRFALLSLSVFSGPATAASSMTDDQIKAQIIHESLASYPGNCPCPYNFARNGSSCGRRSAYSRPGGYSPLCYPSDVSQQMVADYRRAHSIPPQD
ncbi:MAG: hypothetical protein WAN65_13425 [Candidatus Sulfotelmatobacter sp.]